MELKLSKIYKVVKIDENPTVGRIPDWVKELQLKVYNEIEITIDLSLFYATGHNMTIMNLETGKSISINSKSFSKSLMYSKIILEGK